jgi:hypothetical protein
LPLLLMVAVVAALVTRPVAADVVLVGNPAGPPLLDLQPTGGVPDQELVDLDADGLIDLQFGASGNATASSPYGEGTVQGFFPDSQQIGRRVLIASTTGLSPSPFGGNDPGEASVLLLDVLVGPGTDFIASATDTPSFGGTVPFLFYGQSLFDTVDLGGGAIGPSGAFEPDGGPFTGFFGFAFQAGGTVLDVDTDTVADGYAGGQLRFGYGRVTVRDDATNSFTVDYLAYETSGEPIRVGAVPEPATGVLALAGLALAATRRRSRLGRR